MQLVYIFRKNCSPSQATQSAPQAQAAQTRPKSQSAHTTSGSAFNAKVGSQHSEMLLPRPHLLIPLFLALPSVLDMLLALASWETVSGGFHSTKVLRPCGEPSSDTTFTSRTPAWLTGCQSLPRSPKSPSDAASKLMKKPVAHQLFASIAGSRVLQRRPQSGPVQMAGRQRESGLTQVSSWWGQLHPCCCTQSWPLIHHAACRHPTRGCNKGRKRSIKQVQHCRQPHDAKPAAGHGSAHPRAPARDSRGWPRWRW